LTKGLLLILLVLVGVLGWKVIYSDTTVQRVGNTSLDQALPDQTSLPQLKSPQISVKQTKLPATNAAKVPTDNTQGVGQANSAVLPMSYKVKAASGLSLIVDDMGYDVPALRRLLNLSIPITISILPNAPFAVKTANITHQAGQMVMLHLPMEPMGEHYRNRMDASFLRSGMDEATVRDMMLHDLARIPYVQGVNNHMGSRLTSMIEPMAWVMQVCREKSLFFVDSKTSSKSLAATVAKQYGLVWGSRAIFLDNSVEPAAMQKAWRHMQRCVKRQQRCIVIAHPHRQTLAFLERKLSVLQHWPMYPLQDLLHTPTRTDISTP